MKMRAALKPTALNGVPRNFKQRLQSESLSSSEGTICFQP